MNVFTFDQFKAFLLNKSINLYNPPPLIVKVNVTIDEHTS